MKKILLGLIIAINLNISHLEAKILVAYFSASGITEKVAKNLAEVTGGDLYKITPEKPYTDADLDWHNKKSRSSVEMADKSSRPKIAGKIENMNEYDTVYLGFPIWWGIAPTIINTFLESYDLKGKTIIPFCTSGSSGVGESEKYLKTSVSKETKWKKAKRFSSSVSKAELKKWADSLNINETKNRKDNNMQRVYEFLKKAKTYYLATVEGDQPRVRPFGTVKIFEDKLYIQTGKVKNVSKQIGKNPKVEICAMLNDEWIRISGILVNDDRIEAKKAMLDDYSSLQGMYKADDDNTQVLYFKDAVATIYSFNHAPETIRF